MKWADNPINIVTIKGSTQVAEYIIDEPWRSQMYGLVRDRPQEGWILVTVVPSENPAKILLFWEKTV